MNWSSSGPKRLGLYAEKVETQGDHSSWKVTEFSKTIFQAWKVMENSQCHGKSWNDDDVLEFFVKMH